METIWNNQTTSYRMQCRNLIREFDLSTISWTWSLSCQALLSPTHPPRYICIFRGNSATSQPMGICFQSPSKHHTHWIYFFKAIGGNHRTRCKFYTCYLQSSILLHLCLSSRSSAWWVSPISKNRVKLVASLKSPGTWWWAIIRPVQVIIFTLYVYILVYCQSGRFCAALETSPLG